MGNVRAATLKAGRHYGVFMRRSIPPLVALGVLLAGLVVPPAAASPYVWQMELVDSRGVITQAALAIDAEGNPHIAYYESSGRDLRYATWNGTAWLLEDVDTAGDVGWTPSVTVDLFGTPHIVYQDVTADVLKHAVREATGWQIEDVDAMGSVDSDVRLASSTTGLDGTVHVCYYQGPPASPSGGMMYARETMSSWLNESVDMTPVLGNGALCSIALDSLGYPHLAYRGGSGGPLKHAAWNGTAWNITTVDSTNGVSYRTKIALDASGNPFTGYSTSSPAGRGKLVRWNGSAWEVLAPAILGASFLNLEFDSLGRLHTSDPETYRIWDGSWTNETLPSLFGGGGASELALTAADEPRIAFSDVNGDLHYAVGYAQPQLPTAPRNLQAFGSDGQMSLTWTAPAWDGGSPIIGYRLYRSTPPTPYEQSTTPDNLTTWTDTSVTNGLTYYYRVAAVTAIGEGPPSNEVTAIPSGPGDDPPACLITFPTGGTVSGVEIVQGTATDPESSLDLVEVRVSGGEWTPAAGTAIWVYAWNSSLVADGAHTIDARAFDGTEYSAICSVTVTTDNGIAPPPPPDGDFLRDYGWAIILLLVVLLVIGFLVFVRRRRRRPEEPSQTSPP